MGLNQRSVSANIMKINPYKLEWNVIYNKYTSDSGQCAAQLHCHFWESLRNHILQYFTNVSYIPPIITGPQFFTVFGSVFLAYDLATQCPSRRASIRRHTIVVCNSESGSQSLPHSRPQSRGPTLSSASSETDSGNLGCTLPEMSWSRSSLQDELLQSVCMQNWQRCQKVVDRKFSVMP